jgi:hypothetical protein
VCDKAFSSLQLAFLAYAATPGRRSQSRWCHKRCAETRKLFGANLRLWRADYFLKRWLTELLAPDIAPAAMKDLPRRIGPWSGV